MNNTTTTQEIHDGLKAAECALDLVTTSLVRARNTLVNIQDEIQSSMALLRATVIAIADEESKSNT